MMIEICIPLYGAPGDDLGLEGKHQLDPRMVEEQGIYLHFHLFRVASVVSKLQSLGWKLVDSLSPAFVLTYSSEELFDLPEVIEQLDQAGVPLDLVELYDAYQE